MSSEEDQIDAAGAVEQSPSIGTDALKNPGSFAIPGEEGRYQTIVASGIITKDQVFATETLDTVLPPQAIKDYETYLVNSNQVRAPGSLSDKDLGINQVYIDRATKARTNALNAIAGTEFTEESLITAVNQNKALSATTESSVKTADTDFVSPSVVNTEGSNIPANTGVYAYQSIDLYDDRYDFETGKKIRVGIASGVGGGAGDNTTKGNTSANKEQLEPIIGPQ